MYSDFYKPIRISPRSFINCTYIIKVTYANTSIIVKVLSRQVTV